MKSRNIRLSQQGAALPEYVLLTSVLAVALLIGVTALTDNIDQTWAKLNEGLSPPEVALATAVGGGTRSTEPPSNGGVAGGD